MNHRMLAMVMVVVMVLGAIAPAAPIQSSGPPEPDVRLPKGYEPVVPVFSSPYVTGVFAHKPAIVSSAMPLPELMRSFPYVEMAPKALHVRGEIDSVVSVLAPEQRYEPLDLSLRIATDALPRRHVALQPTLSTYTVTTTADSGPGSLRQCLLDATPGTTCSFDPLAFPPGAPATIALLSPLPSIVTDSLTIDGSNAGVVLNGSSLSTGDGLIIYGADGVIIRGLQILNFPRLGIALGGGASNVIIGGDRSVGAAPLGQGNLISGNSEVGVLLQGVGTTGNHVLGNYIGTDATGIAALGNDVGVQISFGATDNVVGGDTANVRNIISGNSDVGVKLQNDGTSGNQVLGNYIGTDATGIAALGNDVGVLISGGAAYNTVGGETAGARNVISGNGVGIQIQLTGTTGNQVRGNYIGTDAAGAAMLGNIRGVLIGWGATDNVIGGDTAGARNIVSGNANSGIQIQGSGTTGNRVLGNYIGIDATGTTRLQNAGGVVIMAGATGNVIGGDTAGARNVVSGNAVVGIQIQGSGTTGNHVLGNYVGTDATGTAALGNGGGVVIAFGATDNVVGGDTANVRNIISGNSDVGVQLQDNGTSGNQVLGNHIGTDVVGTGSLGNEDGVRIARGATNNLIGGDTTGARNVISGNNDAGVHIQGAGTTGNQVLGNYIGTNATGIASLSNDRGVILMDGATDNVIGGDTTGARNVISGNDDVGIWFQNSGSTGNRVLGNYVGTDVTGMVALSNQYGILIGFEATGNIIGGDTDGARNVISGNESVGILIQNGGTTGNQVLGNYIGIDTTGIGSLGNDKGVVIAVGAADNIIGGNTAGARNIISANSSGNDGFAVWLQNDGTTGNQVVGNYIGMNAMGTAMLGNDGGVFIGFGATDNIVGGGASGAGNLISGNGDGVWLQDTRTTGNEVIGNDIVSNTLQGVYLGDGANANTIGVSNTIAYNDSAGVVVNGVTTRGNTVTRNNIHSNGDLPIKFINTPIPISAPVLTTPLCSGTALLPVTGSACPNCVIELYGNPAEGPGGTVFLAETTAGASGDFSTTVICVLAYPYLSATATGLDGTTSEFYPGSTATSWAMVFLPLVMRQTGTGEQQGIYGRVIYNGVGVTGIHLDLRFYDGAGWSTQATAVTAANGDYQFTGMPGLGAGQAYYVRYLNGDSGGNADNPNYLFSWYAPFITDYASGDWISGGDFDIADVPLVSPSNNASVTLPTNFLWTRRSITDDSYKFVLYYPALNQVASTDLLGYVQGITVNGLPSGWPSGGVYYWWVQVHHGDGTENYGEAYGANRVTIYASTQAASSLTLSPGKGVEMYERGLQVSLEQSP